MKTTERRDIIIEELTKSSSPISASALAKNLGVSRQIIVGDIALLRAKGHSIFATPKGYILEEKENKSYIVPCCHDSESLLDELYTIVDCGCGILDVIVDHKIYGQLVGKLHIFSRKDADDFVTNMKAENATPLCSVTNQLHLHTLSCPTEKHFFEVEEALKNKGFIID